MPSQVPHIEVDGSPLDESLTTSLIDTVVDASLMLADMFTMRFSDPQRSLFDNFPLKIGAEVVIKTGPLGEEPTDILVHGEVTTIEAEMSASGSFLIVRGYDKSHRLRRGSKTKTFNDMTDSDLVNKIVSDAGLDVGAIDSTSLNHVHIGQVNMSDWDFIQSRGRECSRVANFFDGKFNFTDISKETDSIDVVFGQDILEFRPRVTGVEQVHDLELRGWNYETKEAVVGNATTTDNVTLSESTVQIASLASAFSSPPLVSVGRPFANDGEVAAAQDALAADRSSTVVEATGMAIGNSKVLPPIKLKIDGVGTLFGGTWSVSQAHHVFNHDGYTTYFSVSGMEDRSMLGLVGGDNGVSSNSDSRQRINGVVIGVVTDADDPMKIGRVKIKMPWLADVYESNWARVCYPGAGPTRGFMLIPEIGDEVLVAFDHGDVNYPYVVGSLYNGVDKPADDVTMVDGSDGAVTERRWESRSGAMIAFGDKDGSETLRIIASDKSSIIIDIAKDEITIEGGNKITVKSGGDLKMEATGNFELKAQGTVKIESQQTAEFKASMGATIDGGAQTAIKGSMVSLN